MGIERAPSEALAQCLQELSAAWDRNESVELAALVGRAPAGERQTWLHWLVEHDLSIRRQRGSEPSLDEYLSRFPGDRELIAGVFSGLTLACSPTPPPADATEKTSATQTWKPGTLNVATGFPSLPQLAGYDVLATLGRGGMGYVLKARDVALDRLVAIKLPLIDRLGDAADFDRFVREARSAGRLRHPNICPIYEIGQAGDRPYIAMGFIAGQTLSEWANAQQPSGHCAAELAASLAEAVAYAHAHGVIHRDIKPANVMIDQETGQPILMDFGLAKEVGENEAQLTQTGMILGTPAYMAPEQASGQPERVGPPAATSWPSRWHWRRC